MPMLAPFLDLATQMALLGQAGGVDEETLIWAILGTCEAGLYPLAPWAALQLTAGLRTEPGPDPELLAVITPALRPGILEPGSRFMLTNQLAKHALYSFRYLEGRLRQAGLDLTAMVAAMPPAARQAPAERAGALFGERSGAWIAYARALWASGVLIQGLPQSRNGASWTQLPDWLAELDLDQALEIGTRIADAVDGGYLYNDPRQAGLDALVARVLDLAPERLAELREGHARGLSDPVLMERLIRAAADRADLRRGAIQALRRTLDRHDPDRGLMERHLDEVLEHWAARGTHALPPPILSWLWDHRGTPEQGQRLLAQLFDDLHRELDEAEPEAAEAPDSRLALFRDLVRRAPAEADAARIRADRLESPQLPGAIAVWDLVGPDSRRHLIGLLGAAAAAGRIEPPSPVSGGDRREQRRADDLDAVLGRVLAFDPALLLEALGPNAHWAVRLVDDSTLDAAILTDPLDAWRQDLGDCLDQWLESGTSMPTPAARDALARLQQDAADTWPDLAGAASRLLDPEVPAPQQTRALLDLLLLHTVAERLRPASEVARE